MIHFDDGTSLTNEEAAALIRQEPYGLITGVLIDTQEHRCAGGVLAGSTFGNPCPKKLVRESCSLGLEMIDANNSFRGTPEERREFMAQWFEARPD